MACALDIKAARTVFTGMNHSVNYDAENPKLRAFGAAHGLDMQCGFDGWASPVQLTCARSIDETRVDVDRARGQWRTISAPTGEVAYGDSVPSFRYDNVPGMSQWEQDQSPSPQWTRPPLL